MIHDIAPHTYDAAFRMLKPRPGDRVVVCREGKILVSLTEEGVDYPTFEDFGIDISSLPLSDEGASINGSFKTARASMSPAPYVYLFAIDDIRFFLIDGLPDRVPSGCAFLSGYELRVRSPRHLVYAGLVAMQFYGWYESTHYCGRCATPLVHSTVERMRFCPSCSNLVYPRINPAVIVGITSGDKVLVTRYAEGEHHAYALVAGFTETGETIEETVHREVMEEVGLKVKNLRFYKSQPWPLSGSVLMGFFCEVDGSMDLQVDEEELAEAIWIDRHDLPEDDDEISLTREMMSVIRSRR